ncbi:MAG: class II glutamine amidotransferase [Candidatus Bathyarchaeia archaeon]|nr:class II glutamine amidotransferase [Candidatus Bathyarchaeota archaeon]
MCRLLGLIGSGFPYDIFREFALLARKGHVDGWGLVYFDNVYPMVLGLSDRSILDEMDVYLSISRRVSESGFRIMIAHIRKASEGIPVSIANTQPFIYHRWAFCHNGTIRDVGKLDVKLPLNGSSDSERLFKYIVQLILDGYDIREALKHIHSIIEDYTALNFILSDGEILYAYRYCRIDENYYTIHYLKNRSYVVVCSEALERIDGRWLPLDNNQLLSIDRDLNIYIDRIV